MRERPIIFSAQMILALRDGRKTQTRRPVKLNHAGRVALGGRNWHVDDPNAVLACQYGQPGDLLWVRETWGTSTKSADAITGAFYESPWYRADADDYGLLGHDGLMPVYVEQIKWRPSIHMPRWASRITLRITDVRVQRLQEISEADAMAEGADPFEWPDNPRLAELRHVDGFAALWRSIYGPDSWAKDPWVWALTFEVIHGNVDAVARKLTEGRPA